MEETSYFFMHLNVHNIYVQELAVPETIFFTGNPSSETQGQIVGGKCERATKKSAQKSVERGGEPLGTKFHRASSKRSASFWLLIGARSLYFPTQSQGSCLGVRSVCSNTKGTRSKYIRHISYGLW